MNDFQKAKIIKFINDKEMSDAVFQVVLDSFLKKKPNQDVYLLAASRLSVDFLTEGWAELEKHKNQVEEKIAGLKQIGL